MAKATLAPEVLDALRSFDSPTISNAIEAFRVRDRGEGYASRELRCQTPHLPPLVGWAVTCTADTTSPGTPRVNRLHELLEAVAVAPKPVVVVIQHVGPATERSCVVGDMVCTAFWRLGAVGVVTDAGIRDLTGIRARAPDFNVFSPGAVVSHGNAATLDVNVPISIGGLTVEPGDLLHGDESGLVQIPLAIAEDVLVRAWTVREEENEIFRYLEGASIALDEIKRRLGH